MSLGKIIGYTGMIAGATSFVGSFIAHIACRGSEPSHVYIGTGGLVAIMAFGALARLSGEQSSITGSIACGDFPGRETYKHYNGHDDDGHEITTPDDDPCDTCKGYGSVQRCVRSGQVNCPDYNGGEC